MSPMALEPRFDDLRAALGAPGAQAAVNLHLETEHHFLEAHVFGHDTLVVTFEDAMVGGARPDRYRQGWGVAPFLRRGVSVLAVKPKFCHWYAHPDLPEAFERLRPFFTRFARIVHYGMSMGGFAALTYADLTGAARVVTFAPQSSYRKIGGRQETRYPQIHDFDHSGPYGDAVTGCLKVPEIWLIYDPMEIIDRWHARRFTSPAVRRLHTPFFAHGVPYMLQQLDALHVPVDLCLTGEVDETGFYRLLRRRREIDRYQKFLKHKARQHPNVQARLNRILPDAPGPA